MVSQRPYVRRLSSSPKTTILRAHATAETLWNTQPMILAKVWHEVEHETLGSSESLPWPLPTISHLEMSHVDRHGALFTRTGEVSRPFAFIAEATSSGCFGASDSEGGVTRFWTSGKGDLRELLYFSCTPVEYERDEPIEPDFAWFWLRYDERGLATVIVNDDYIFRPQWDNNRQLEALDELFRDRHRRFVRSR